MDVRIASEIDKEGWNQFVDQEGGSFHHYYEWKYYYESNPLKYRFIPLIIENNTSEILGIFPIEENLRLVYGFLASLPLGVSGGFLIKNSLNEQEKKNVTQSFLKYIDTNYSSSHSLITIKELLSFSEVSIPPTKTLIDNGYDWLDTTATQLPRTYFNKLEKPFEEKIWMNLWDKSLRRRIRQAKKAGVEVIVDDEFTYLDDFIEMQIQSVKKFNRIQKKEEIKPIFTIFKKKIKLFICLKDSKPISAAVCYFTPTMVHCAFAPYNAIAKDYLTNTLPICASIRYACENGYKYYDHGQTTTPEIAYHKEKFKAIPIPLRIYTKKFSRWKVITNNSYEYIKGYGQNIIGLLKR
jgi:hypothetical protein